MQGFLISLNTVCEIADKRLFLFDVFIQDKQISGLWHLRTQCYSQKGKFFILTCIQQSLTPFHRWDWGWWRMWFSWIWLLPRIVYLKVFKFFEPQCHYHLGKLNSVYVMLSPGSWKNSPAPLLLTMTGCLCCILRGLRHCLSSHCQRISIWGYYTIHHPRMYSLLYFLYMISEHWGGTNFIRGMFELNRKDNPV